MLAEPCSLSSLKATTLTLGNIRETMSDNVSAEAVVVPV
jgi:hypothetical protein